jgi:hypothetical protein
MQAYDEVRFRRQVDAAIEQSKKVLDNTKVFRLLGPVLGCLTRCRQNPIYAADVPHQYEDKYLLSEFLCNTALAAQLNCLEQLGVDAKKLKQLKVSGRPGFGVHPAPTRCPGRSGPKSGPSRCASRPRRSVCF